MKTLVLTIMVALLPEFAYACWQTEYPKATVFGGTISLLVKQHDKPIRFATVTINSDGKVIRKGRTNGYGIFEANDLHIGTYRVNIPKWGKADITVAEPILGKYIALTFNTYADGCLSVTPSK